LEQTDIDKIAYLMLSQVADRLNKRGMHLKFEDEVVALLSKEGYDPQYGARPLRRVIQRTVEDALSEEIIAGNLTLGDDVRLLVKDGKIAFEKVSPNMDLEEEQAKV
jgi:ATP-dependent Clp protease ATP-binding subunit ClpC